MEIFERLAQATKQREQVEDAIHEMSKPLARYADDEDLDAQLKDREREGDPMLAFLAKKKAKKEKKSSESTKCLMFTISTT